MKIKVTLFSFLLLISIFLLIGCSKNNESNSLVIATVIPEFEQVIILSSSEELTDHWHDLDVVIKEFLEDNKDVDIIFGFAPEYLSNLVEDGSIKSLDGLIDNSLIEKLAPVIYTPIRKAGDGKLYAITPIFDSWVLVYNKSIFKEVGIDFPTNVMNWEKVSKLAEEIQDKSKYKGITLGSPTSDEQFYYLFLELAVPIS